jgi:hypothetical protein
MKKAILVLFIVGILAMSIVSADSMTTNVAPPKPSVSVNSTKPIPHPVNPEMTSIKLTGLSNAVVKVKNNETRTHIEAVWSNIQDKEKVKLAELSDITIEKVGVKDEIRGTKDAKLFGLFRASKEYRYELQPNGSIEIKPRMFDFLWKMG